LTLAGDGSLPVDLSQKTDRVADGGIVTRLLEAVVSLQVAARTWRGHV